MSLEEGQLGAFGQLARALGLLDEGGNPNADWFGDPVGGGPGGRGLRNILGNDSQREALTAFVDAVLGPPDRVSHGNEVWVPLFRQNDPRLTISAVVTPVAGAVRLGVGLELAGGSMPSVASRLHVPLFQLARGGVSPPGGGGLPDWLLIGRPDGRVEISVDATLRAAPPPPGEAGLSGIALTLGIPTAAGADLSIRVDLRDLRLPGASAPRSFTLDASRLEDLDDEVFQLLLGLVRAQADALSPSDPALRPFAALAGLLGLRTVAGLPPLPLADLPSRGVSALVEWVEGILDSAPERSAWLGQLALLLGATLDGGGQGVSFLVGAAQVSLGIRVEPGASSHPILTPRVAISFNGRAGARVQLAADLLRADTGTGSVSAFPDVRAEAIFGADAGGGALLAGNPAVGSVHVGFGLNASRAPAFLLTLHDVSVLGQPPRAVLDLSSPASALDAADDLLHDALVGALHALGLPGDLALKLLGLDPPTGVLPVTAREVVADPVAAFRGYWQRLLASPTAMGDVLGVLRRLLRGGAAAPAPGTGTEMDPWRIDLASGIGIGVVSGGGGLAFEIGAEVATTVLRDFTARVRLALTLLRVDFGGPRVAFATAARGSLSLSRTDGQVARLEAGPIALAASRIGVAARWSAGVGLRGELEAEGLALEVDRPLEGSVEVHLPLPRLDALGRLVLDAPDWDEVEAGLAALLGLARSPEIDAALALLGWTGRGSRLSLDGLFGGDPATAIEAWLSGLALECRPLRAALSPVAALLSGFSRPEPLGSGAEDDPFRCPVSGDAGAPALAVWLVPPCPPLAAPRPINLLGGEAPAPPEALVAALAAAAASLPDVASLLVARDSLAEGLTLLASRWADTDGLVGAPGVLPAGVDPALVLQGSTYGELVAQGSTGYLVAELFEAPPAAVVHVGCEATWVADRPAGTAFDLTAEGWPSFPASGPGTWFVRLPAPAAAAAARPDRGAVGEQATRLATLLSARTGPVTVVAYGPAGAAAVRAAATATQVAEVITVGTPWAGLSVDALRSGLPGDALALLGRLIPADASTWADPLFALEAEPLQTMREVVKRSLALAEDPSSLPGAESEVRRGGLRVRPVFGSLPADEVASGLDALVADGIRARTEAAEAAAPAAAPDAVHDELHAGVDLPVLALSAGGLSIHADGTLELAALGRTEAGLLQTLPVRGLLVRLRISVTDGWLVGGPGAASREVEVRWLSAFLRIPFDGRPGTSRFVLHEARAFAVSRERWTVHADAGGVDATVALPEVRIILSAAMARLRSATPAMATLLEQVGVARDGGIDPDGVDRLLHDPVAMLGAARAASAVPIATSLRALVPGATGTGGAVTWLTGPSTIALDLVARTFSATVAAAGEGVLRVAASIGLTPEAATCELSLGELEPGAGGLRVVARAGPVAEVALEWQAPGAEARRLRLLPPPGPAEVADLQALVTVLLPAALAHGALAACRNLLSLAGRPIFEAVLDALGMLRDADDRGVRAIRLPVGLFQDPGAWLRHGVERWRTDPAGSAISLLDALRPLVAPAGGPGRWPLGGGVAVTYSAAGGQVHLGLDVDLEVTLDGHTVATQLGGGLQIGSGGPPLPELDAAVTVDGKGLAVTLSPHPRLSLVRPAPTPPLELYPEGPGLGSVLAAVGDMVLPPVLNALVARRSDVSASLVKDVAAAVFDVAGALDLLEAGAFTSARLSSFAADPAGRLLGRLPMLVAQGAATLAHALDPGGTVVRVTGPTGGRVILGFGAASGVSVTLDGSGATPAIELQASATLPGVGAIALQSLRLSAEGVRVAARLGPAAVSAGPFSLYPLVVVSAGVGGAGFTRSLGLGLALDSGGTSAIQLRWSLDESPPVLVVTGAGGSEDTSAEAVAVALLGQAASLAMGLLVAELGPVVSARARRVLRGAVFQDVDGSTALDGALVADLVHHPERLLARLERLLWNAVSESLSVTFGPITVGLVAQGPAAGPKQMGVGLTLAAGQRFSFSSGDPTVELEIDAGWVDPPVNAGLSVYVIQGQRSGDTYTFSFAPGVSIAGLGLRFSSNSGPLLDLGGASLDAIALHLYGEATLAGLGGGVHLKLDGFAVSPGGSGGSNAVANGILDDAGRSGAANRPSLSPALAVQIHPGQPGPSVSLRAGDPPGPWWVLVQRQLGPLYMERVGLDTAEDGGRLVRISLLFDGRVSLFGLTASVDQLSVSWLGGEVFDPRSWAVDLQGLAIAADMSGVSLSGGLLKTVQDGQVSYVGMLSGRFGIYGLSVFGGYTDDRGSPSFFVFGAFNGPIGGPPAFFITGIGGGLGINRGLRVPEDLSRFNEYPFIQALDISRPARDPMVQLRELSTYFPAQRGSFWFAAGISFNCFSLVDGIAVLSVSFGDGLDINLFGLARMALPRPGAALISIELGLLARFSTREGLFSIRAQLTDNSWLLYEDVRLTGGFAFVVWWKGPLKGQFVLTLGGYHPSFHRDGYPDVPRLGLTWRISDQIVVKGESYFALTSEALMAGVSVELSADFGWAWVRVAFGADGIVYFDPFFFDVMAYARISAGVEIDVWLGTISFSVSLGASIHVWGPDFSGEATFSVGPVSLTVPFGSRRAIPGRVLGWGEFVAKYLEDGGGMARALTAITGRGTVPSATDGERSAPTADGSAARPFEVFSEFELTVTTSIPTRRFDLGLPGGPRVVPVTLPDGAAAELGLAPMNLGALSSDVTLTLASKLPAGGYTDLPEKLRLLGANLEAASPRPEGSSLGTDAFPIGAWGPPQPDTRNKALPKGDVLFAGNSIRLVAEATQMERGPEIDYYRVEATRRPLPLQAGGAARPALLALAGEVQGELPAPTTATAALAAAQSRLFAGEGGATSAGTLPRGPRSHLERASFSGGRVAPPLFGTLADGLAVQNAPDGIASKQGPPPARQPRPPRAPTVVALLTSGAGVVARAPRTTVSNPKIKRRPAPSTASVEARFAPHLPIRLTRSPLPSTKRSGTLVATGSVPPTGAPGMTRTYHAGTLGGVRGLDGLVGGLGRAAPPLGTAADALPGAGPGGSLIAAGDVLVMHVPDAHRDLDASARPSLSLSGSARVTVLRREGLVLVDQRASGTVTVPPGAALIGIQAGGLDPASEQETDGLPGWVGATRLAALGSRAALGPGCVLHVEARRSGSGAGWVTAAEVVADASVVSTRFARPVRTLVVALEGADPDPLEWLKLELGGAARATGPDANVRPPVVVLRGTLAVLLYAVVPGQGRPVIARVTAGGPWRIAGVLGASAAPDRLAKVVLERGLVALAARTLARGAATCAVTWNPPAAAAPVRQARAAPGGKHGRR